VLPNIRVARVPKSEAPVFIWHLLRPSQPVSSFLREYSRTAWQQFYPCFWNEHLYVAFSRVWNPTGIYIPASEWKTKTSVKLRTNSNIPISKVDFISLLVVEQDILFIHGAAFSILHVCACRKYMTLSCVILRMLRSDTFTKFFGPRLFT
jgi:hypothetical protein